MVHVYHTGEGLTTLKIFVHLACKFTQNTQNLREFSYTQILSGQPLAYGYILNVYLFVYKLYLRTSRYLLYSIRGFRLGLYIFSLNQEATHLLAMH